MPEQAMSGISGTRQLFAPDGSRAAGRSMKAIFEGPVQERRESNVRFKQSLHRTRLPLQRRVRRFYKDWRVRIAIALIIVLSFVEEIISLQVDPSRSEAPKLWYAFDIFFLALFTAELAVNLYAHWNQRLFWASGFNWFDIVLVSSGISIATLGGMRVDAKGDNLNQAWLTLRALRSLRVLRIFRRVHALWTTLSTVQRAIGRCLTTLALMLFVGMVFAVVGATIFRTAHVYVGPTSRGHAYSDEYWGTWARALYTLFQVWTLESWSEAVARPLIFSDDSHVVAVACIYFPLYNLINSVFLINVLASIFVDQV